MAVEADEGQREGYELKLNSYDLGVDIELADAISRLRFEHPEVRCCVLTGGFDRVFCAGANIVMLRTSTHGFKVNFCKFTNETRLGIEDASEHSGVRFLAALNGTASGGGYELALACDKILLVDDRNSAVSFPEVPLFGRAPGHGRPDSHHRQAQDPPRPHRLLQHRRRRHQGQARRAVGPRGPSRPALPLGRGRGRDGARAGRFGAAARTCRASSSMRSTRTYEDDVLRYQYVELSLRPLPTVVRADADPAR